jgi:hypothetical protein
MMPVTDLPSVVSVIEPGSESAPPANEPVAGEVALADNNPERLSVAVKGMTTTVLYQPGVLCAVLGDPYVSIGATVSTMTFGGVPLGVTVGAETAVAVATVVAAGLFTY